jgi:hypothetical protein
VAPDGHFLTVIMRPLTRDQRAGCRRWAVRELGILRDSQALGDLVSALGDEEPLVRSEACTSLGMLGQAAPHSRPATPLRCSRLITSVAASSTTAKPCSCKMRRTDVLPAPGAPVSTYLFIDDPRAVIPVSFIPPYTSVGTASSRERATCGRRYLRQKSAYVGIMPA